nr:MAG TPA: hypothetical protein [Caudoviricetes sp.]
MANLYSASTFPVMLCAQRYGTLLPVCPMP